MKSEPKQSPSTKDFSHPKKLRIMAFYLPQYHPIPENDEWWGKGFTDWKNVVKAKPLISGHYQPHLPSDLGFYDLRSPEVREAQAALAREYGIYGFCYYHYWFHGRKLLGRPFEEVLLSGKPDFPFALCWVNENWSRNWDGRSSSILLKQEYSHEDHRNHVKSLLPVFEDRRYIRVGGKPLFLFYRASQIPSLEETVSIWRQECRAQGIGEIYLCKVESMMGEYDPTSVEVAFDASVEFQPRWKELGAPLRRSRLWKLLQRLRLSPAAYSLHRFYDYQEVADRMSHLPPVSYKRYPCVTPSWDNTARRPEDGVVLLDSTPQKYQAWLETVLNRFEPFSTEENFVFINAWNEWAEGNHLEPCQKWGPGYLEATLHALKKWERSGE